jgi:hypothetical protein
MSHAISSLTRTARIWKFHNGTHETEERAQGMPGTVGLYGGTFERAAVVSERWGTPVATFIQTRSILLRTFDKPLPDTDSAIRQIAPLADNES